MSYTPQSWANGPASGTPLNASRMAHMEAGIKDASDRLDNVPNGYAPKLHAAQHGPSGSDPLSGYYAARNPPVFECKKVGSFVHDPNTSFFANTGWTITTDTANGGTYGTSQASPMQYKIPLAGRWDVEFRAIWGNTSGGGTPAEIRVYLNGLDTTHWLTSDQVNVVNNFYGNGSRAHTTAVLAQNDMLYWLTAIGTPACTIYDSRGTTELTKVTFRWVGPA